MTLARPSNTESCIDKEEFQAPFNFQLPREIAWFLIPEEDSSSSSSSNVDKVTDDHNYMRKRIAIEYARILAHGIRESMSARVFSIDAGSLEYFGNPKDVRYLTGVDMYSALRKIVTKLSEKLDQQLQEAEKRSPPFIPTIERVIRQIGQPEVENKIFRFIKTYESYNFSDIPNARSFHHRFQPMRGRFRGDFDSFLPATLICTIFQDEDILLPKVMTMFRQQSVWVTNRLLPSITDPVENACNANEAMRLVLQGLELAPSGYHALESPIVQKALGESPIFLATEAGRVHVTLHGGGGSDADHMGVDGMGDRQSSTTGGHQNKLRDALAQRDRTKKESVFEVLTMLRQDSTGASAQKLEGAEQQQDNALPSSTSFDGASADNFTKGMMGKAPSAVFDPNEGLDQQQTEADDSASTTSPNNKKKSSSSPQDEDESTDDSKMKVPYKNDLEYLEDQFQLLQREKAVIRNKFNLHEAEIAGKDEETGGGDEEQDFRFGGRPPRQTMDKNKIENDLRKSKVRLTIHAALCKSRLRATSEGKWYPRLEILSEALEFTRFEKLVVLELIKSIISPDREPHHHFGRRNINISTLQEKFCSSLEERMACRKSFYKTGTLIREGIIYCSDSDFMEDLSELQVDLDRRMLDFLIGADSEVAEMVDGSFLFKPSVNIDDVILPAEKKRRLLEVVTHFDETKKKRAEFGLEERYSKGFGSIILLHGPPGTGKTQTAHAVATLLKKKVLLVNFPSLPPNASGKIISFLFREAKLNSSLLFFDECESLFGTRDKGNYQVNQLLTEIERFDGLCILATNRPQEIDEAMHRRINLQIEFSKPDHILREQIWKCLCPPKLPIDDKVNFAELALKFELQGGFIKNAYLGALSIMVANKHDKIYQKDLEQAAREQVVGRLGLAEFDKKVTPTAGLDSVIVSDKIQDALKDIINNEKASQVMNSSWGFGAKHGNQGISVLMCGASGCGKTLAASAIGFELGKPLKVVNAAQIVSKWVGESAKNLEAIFTSAQTSDAILVLDEAEALFGSRDADASRHDTMNVGVLLQQIENFRGICVVITNLKDRIDTAFFRRFRFILEFQRPDAKLREKIWRVVTPAECPLADDVDFNKLAQHHDLTGGQIKQVVLRAATRAALRTDEKQRKLFMADFEKSCTEEEEKQGGKPGVGMYI